MGVIYSALSSQDMNNQVTLEANIKYVLIKQCEVVESEASSSCNPINNTTETAPKLQKRLNLFSVHQWGNFFKDKQEDLTDSFFGSAALFSDPETP